MNLKHIALIMDGNGRWATQRGYPRFFGHIRGCKIVSDIVEKASRIGVQSLTLYAFSTENWKRPDSEIQVLFKLFKKFLKKEEIKLLKNGIALKFIGDLSALSPDVRKLAMDVRENTKLGTKMDLILAVNYGSKAEILKVMNELKSFPHPITESDVQKHLWNPQVPEIDLLIRTGGDHRISNFLLWQSAYAEFYFESKLWPDFSTQDFEKILETCSKRERRFGDIEPKNLEKEIFSAL